MSRNRIFLLPVKRYERRISPGWLEEFLTASAEVVLDKNCESCPTSETGREKMREMTNPFHELVVFVIFDA